MYTCLKSQLPLAGCERLSTMVCCIIRSVSVILLLTQGGFCAVVTGPSNATVLLDQTHELICVVAADDIPTWEEVLPDGNTERLYTLLKRFSTDSKYSNFYISGTLPDYNLRVETVQIEDMGVYRCATTESDISDARLSVEGPPSAVTIDCSSSTNCPADEENFSSEVTCTCKATGAYPESLQLEWTDATPNSVVTTTLSSTGREGSFDFTQTAVANVTGSTGVVQCALIGYVSNIPEDVRKASYDYSSPACSLRALPDRTTCKTADFNCSCESDKPKVSKWSLFSQNMTKIGDSDDGIFQDVDISANKTSTFYCRGCNGIYGEDSLASTPVTCELATTTPTMTLMTTFTPVKGQGLPLYGIILIVLVCVGVACGTGIAVYCFCCPTSDQESVKRSNNLALRGGNTNPSYTEPAYDEVEKDTQAKSDNTDGNGVNSKLQSEPDQVEYAAVNKPKPDPQPAPRSSKPPGNNTEPEKVELQYADIDHSNRGRSNEIRQPADEPTEYATVQSVIV